MARVKRLYTNFATRMSQRATIQPNSVKRSIGHITVYYLSCWMRKAHLLKSVSVVSSCRSSPQRRPRLLDPTRLRPTLPPTNHYTALENMPSEPKIEDEIIRVPLKNATETGAKPDETAV
ncbi:unnamed protein product [Leptidea sinapis]|nr:unnamed protein product [Leptidea sinapis]